MKHNFINKYIPIVLIFAVFAGTGIWWWRQIEHPERDAIEAVYSVLDALENNSGLDILDLVLMPPAYASRTGVEQCDFIRKALRDEVSEAGLQILARDGEYGSLSEIFPDEAQRWSKLFGVDPVDCVAFRADREKLRTEVVLLKTGDSFRLLRCNNVR